MKKSTTLLLCLAAVLASVLVLPAAAAAQEEPATVRVTKSGDLLVRMLSDNLEVRINSNGPDGYAVWITDNDREVHIYNRFGVTRNVRVEYGEHTTVFVTVGELAPTSIPKDLRVSATGSDYDDNHLLTYDLEVGKDVRLRGRLVYGFIRTTIGDDLLAYPSVGPMSVTLQNSDVVDRIYVRSNDDAGIQLALTDSTAGSVRVSGSPYFDRVSLKRSEIDGAVRATLRGGNDRLDADESVWEGRLVYRGHAGIDYFESEAMPGNVFDVGLGDGDDILCIWNDLPNDYAGSRFHGGSGHNEVDCGAELTNAQITNIIQL